MKAHDMFWKLDALSDRQLLERVGAMLGSTRRLMAELIAHLGEVEERRLHLAAACSSLFAYCLTLGMTEDEAYRRIEVARLARRYPAIFPLLANGQLSLSVVALLKHYLSDENHVELLATVTGKSVAQTRELVAARFPRPDVASSVRKLPERRTMIQPSFTMSATEPRTSRTETHEVGRVPDEAEARGTETRTDGMEPRGTETHGGGTQTHGGRTESPRSVRAVPPHRSSRIEPLSAERYKVQLTASAELARKLQLATDLMRHSHPSGDLGPIVERAVDLLIESLMHRRFGKTKKASSKPTSVRARSAAPQQRGWSCVTGPLPEGQAHTAEPGTAGPDTTPPHAAKPATTTVDTSKTAAPTLGTAARNVDRRDELERASTPLYIPRSTRRAVVERDGLGCGWVDEHGTRCGSRAWLEYDHRHPRGKGGGREPDNVRLLCRHHNRFAAEREYGRRHVEQSIAERQRAPDVAPAI